jgi:hypothetical protein
MSRRRKNARRKRRSDRKGSRPAFHEIMRPKEMCKKCRERVVEEMGLCTACISELCAPEENRHAAS